MLVSKAAYDTPIAAVMALDHSFGADGIVAAATINTLADLKNKKVEWIDYQEQQAPAKHQEWLEAFNTIAEIKAANGRISRKPEAQKFLNHALLEKLYETGQ